MNRPIVELFALMSVDGKLTIGTPPTDFDRDIPKMPNAKEGLYQYYEAEKQTADVSIISGEICSKLRPELREYSGPKIPATCVVIDRSFKSPASSIEGLSRKFNHVLWFYERKYSCEVAVKDKTEEFRGSNVSIMHYVLLSDILEHLYEHGHEVVCLQTGGTINAAFLRCNLIDRVHLIVAPIVCGGSNTTTLVDGYTCGGMDNILSYVKELSLRYCNVLKDGYIELMYDVIK